MTPNISYIQRYRRDNLLPSEMKLFSYQRSRLVALLRNCSLRFGAELPSSKPRPSTSEAVLQRHPSCWSPLWPSILFNLFINTIKNSIITISFNPIPSKSPFLQPWSLNWNKSVPSMVYSVYDRSTSRSRSAYVLQEKLLWLLLLFAAIDDNDDAELMLWLTLRILQYFLYYFFVFFCFSLTYIPNLTFNFLNEKEKKSFWSLAGWLAVVVVFIVFGYHGGCCCTRRCCCVLTFAIALPGFWYVRFKKKLYKISEEPRFSK